MSDLPERLRELSDVLIGCEWDVPLCAAEDCVRAADEIERLQSLLEPCRHDSDTQTDSGYPCTTNDYLSLLSAYIADYMPEECIPGDEYFAAWERAARPVIERLTREPCEWRYDDTHYKHDTSCGHAWQFMDDGVKENGVQYCPFCGGEIQENTGGE